MSNLDAFLKEMREEGKKLSGSGSAGIIGKVLIEFGAHRYVAGHDFWEFWTPVKSAEEIQSKGAELATKLREVGCTDAPAFGVRVTIRANVLSAEQPYKKDLVEFTPQWQDDAYTLIENHIREGELSVGKEFYGQVKHLPNPYHVAKGEAGKTDKDQNGNPRFPSIRVPVKAFAGEAEAKAFVAANSTAKDGSLPPFSDTAKANYPDLKSLVSCAEEIHIHLSKAQKGVPFMEDGKNYPLPVPATPPAIKAYIAGIYSIAPGDIDLLRVETPFG